MTSEPLVICDNVHQSYLGNHPLTGTCVNPRPVEASAPSCRFCANGDTPIRSSVSDKMVHMDATGHKLCTATSEASAPAAPPADDFRRIIADPYPRSASQRLPDVIYGRYRNGETVQELAVDYGLPEEQIEWGIRIGYLRACLCLLR